jgi:hypothetical protein
MRVLRAGGEYLAARRDNLRTAVVMVAGVGAIGCTTLSLLVHPMAGVLLAASIASVAGKARNRLRRVTRGIKGEALVAERLQALPDDYYLLNDVVLPGQFGNIDHVVIGPCGVVVIETKNFSGSVQSRRNAWFVNGRRSRSVSKQVNRGAIALRETLSQAHPDLKDSVLRFVESIAVFTNPTRQVKVDRAETIVARYSQLLDVILAIARRKRVPTTVAAKLAETLTEVTPDHARLATGPGIGVR